MLTINFFLLFYSTLKVAYGYFGDFKRVDSSHLYTFSLLLCGLCVGVIPLVIKSYWLTLIFTVVSCALILCSEVLVPIICVELVGKHDFVNAYGLIFFFQGIAGLFGPPLLGI
jgi:ABC-type transport system involved in multi-copper enzyme maturation permease subunit